jgi:shikimate kinase
MNIALLGFMATGKTTVGKLLAERMRYRFIDVDEVIVHRSGKEINDIFETEGEKVFRDLERQVIADISKADKQVIACGGGAILNSENIDNLKTKSQFVVLEANVDEVMLRTMNDDTRPLLKSSDRRSKIQSLLIERSSKYDQVADFIVDTSGLSPKEVVNVIMELLEDSA